MTKFLLKFLVIVCAWCSAAPAAAQSTTGSISGTVSDQSKAVLPGVAINVVNTDTGATRSLVTDADGRFRVLNLPPGPYRLTAELSGFTKVVREGLTVTIGNDILQDLQLGVGAVAENVTVTGEVTSLDTSSAVIGGVVTTKQIAELPLNGRSFMQLATLQPGVSVSRTTERDFGGGFGGTQVSIAGARPEQTGYLMDGTNIADIGDKAPSSVAGVLLGVDTVQEFSVQTHGYSAEFGRAAGGSDQRGHQVGNQQSCAARRSSSTATAASMRRTTSTSATSLPSSCATSSAASSADRSSRTSCSSSAATKACANDLGTTRFARVPNEAAHHGFVPDGAGGLRFVGVHPNFAALPRPALPAAEWQRLRRRHGGIHPRTDRTDESELLRRQDRLEPEPEGRIPGSLLQRLVRQHAVGRPSRFRRLHHDRHAVHHCAVAARLFIRRCSTSCADRSTAPPASSRRRR